MKRFLVMLAVVALVTVAMTTPPVVQTAQASTGEMCYWAYWSGFKVTTWTQLCFAMSEDYQWDGEGLVQAIPVKQADETAIIVKYDLNAMNAIDLAYSTPPATARMRDAVGVLTAMAATANVQEGRYYLRS